MHVNLEIKWIEENHAVTFQITEIFESLIIFCDNIKISCTYSMISVHAQAKCTKSHINVMYYHFPWTILNY